ALHAMRHAPVARALLIAEQQRTRAARARESSRLGLDQVFVLGRDRDRAQITALLVPPPAHEAAQGGHRGRCLDLAGLARLAHQVTPAACWGCADRSGPAG